VTALPAGRPPLLIVRLRPRLTDGTVVGESRRVCHLVPVPYPGDSAATFVGLLRVHDSPWYRRSAGGDLRHALRALLSEDSRVRLSTWSAGHDRLTHVERDQQRT
jgi:hypothetical protein